MASETPSPNMDFTFPEMLARDLGSSEDAFHSKSMTAGPPLHKRLASESQDTLATRTGLVTPKPITLESQKSDTSAGKSSLENSPRKQSLSLSSDTDSMSTAGSDSIEFDPPPVHFRHSFSNTAPTSVATRRSASFSQSLRQSPVCRLGVNQQGSWVDFDMEEAIIEPVDSCQISPLKALRRSRPRSELAFTEAQRAFSLSYASDVARRAGRYQSFDIAGRSQTFTAFSTMGQPFILAGPPFVPQRRSSLTHSNRKMPLIDRLDVVPSPVISRTPTAPAVKPDLRKSVDLATLQILDPSDIDGIDEQAVSPETTAKFDDPDSHSELSTELSEVDDVTAPPTPLEEKVRPALLSPTGNRRDSRAKIHVWLDASTDSSSARKMSSSMSHPGVPLPPEAIESLRISINNFPETMLLTSSLTIETIRAYSKKLKQTGKLNETSDLHSAVSLPTPLAPKASRFGTLPRLLSKRSSMLFSKPSQQVPSTQFPQIVEPSWTTINSVFPTGSDYLCDALYAHIVAYTYVSTIIAGSRPTSPARLPPSSTMPKVASSQSRKSRESDNDEEDRCRIPKKAASLLGLSVAASPTSMAAQSKAWQQRQRDSILSGTGSAVTTREASLLDMHTNLGCCIARLVAALKSAEELGIPEASSPEVKDADPFLVRSLCEMVRLKEAAA
jgi:hypothetical protein